MPITSAWRPSGKPFAFEQDAARLLAADQDIVRPLDLERLGTPAAGRIRIASCTATATASGSEPRRSSRRRIDQQQRGIEIAGFGDPGPAATAAAAGLAVRGDPEPPAIAGPRPVQAFRVGGADVSRAPRAGSRTSDLRPLMSAAIRTTSRQRLPPHRRSARRSAHRPARRRRRGRRPGAVRRPSARSRRSAHRTT